MTSWYDSAHHRFSTETDRVRQRLAVLDVDVLGRDPRRRDAAAQLKAFIYVWIAAALERAVTDLCLALFDELNSRKIPLNQLRPTLLGVALDAKLASVQDLRDYEKLWDRKCELFQTSRQPDPAYFSPDAIPLNKRTIRPIHFDVIWRVFGFAGDPIPGPLHRIALQDLADGRNHVAHGEEDPDKFGRLKQISGLIRLTSQVEDLWIHLVSRADEYLVAQTYLK